MLDNWYNAIFYILSVTHVVHVAYFSLRNIT